MLRDLKLFYGNSNPKLALEISKKLLVKPGKIKFNKFSNGNIKVKIDENVRNDDVFVIQTASNPANEHLMEMLIIIDALKYASAGRITAVLPNYFYARSDKKDEPRISITARLVADLLQTAGADRILTMKLHSPQVMGFPRIPMDQIFASPVLIEHFRSKDLSNTVVAAPDVGSAKSSRLYARALDLPLVVVDKERLGDQEKVAVRHIIGSVEGKNVLLVDDEILSGGSMIEAAKALRENGALKIWAACTHGFFTKNAFEQFDKSPIEEIVTTNTLPQDENLKNSKFVVLSVANMFASAIKAIHSGESVGSLLENLSHLY